MAVTGMAAVIAGLIALPSRGQQPQPNLPLAQVSMPAQAARAATTPVNLTFTLPPGARLVQNPRLRVVNEKNELWELLPTYILKLPPNGSGLRELNTHNYVPGTYRVRAEVDYELPSGLRGTAVSPEVTITVTSPPVGS